jgi:SAM-dependent methyltransferase
MKKQHAANRDSWDTWAEYWHRNSSVDLQQALSHPESAFLAPAFHFLTKEYPKPKGLSACVLGSGDCRCAFALSALGFDTTSVDISGEQLRIASAHASRLSVRMRFLQADATQLPDSCCDQFDLILTSNGFFVWISDLSALFQNVSRILRAGGRMISYDVHPFQRPWKDQPQPLEMTKPYWDRRPTGTSASASPVFEYHWTISDILNSAIGSGLSLAQIAESPSENDSFWQSEANGNTTSAGYSDWHQNPRAGLPVWLLLMLEKQATAKPLASSNENAV